MELKERMLARHAQDSQQYSKEKRDRTQKKRQRKRTIALRRGSIIASEVYLRHNYNSLEILPGNRCSK